MITLLFALILLVILWWALGLVPVADPLRTIIVLLLLLVILAWFFGVDLNTMRAPLR